MCGIAGYIGAAPPPDEALAACLESLRHRGPDGSGTFRAVTPDGRHLRLAHSRLAIIDLDARAAQPMRRGPLTAVFNGEVYNYLELRAALAARGRAFATASDTEVLLAALEDGGEAALDSLEGMWAFACFDERDGGLLLCRDRFGEKPLFLLEAPHGLYFASEVKALAALRGGWPRPNLRQLRRGLVTGYRTLFKSGDTFFEGVRELEPGTLLRVGPGGGASLRRYWTPVFAEEPDMTFAEAVDGARRLLLRSMELRLRADVPLAFCQSGGVDSNSLISMARRVFGYDVHGFTVVNSDERYDEWPLVERTVRELGIRHTAIPVQTGGFLPNLELMVRQHDAPVCTISYYAHWLLIRAVAERGYKVAVSGTGADELFTGYYDHHLMFLAELHGGPLFAKALADWTAHAGPLVRNPLLQDPLAFVKNPAQREHITLDAEKYSALLTQPFAEDFAELRLTPGLLRNRMLNELFVETVPPILREDDLNSMAFSIENRSPYLDRELCEFCNRIPVRHLMGGGYNKRVLREAMRGILPDCVADERRKVGFNASLFDFLDIGDPAVRSRLLEQSPVFDVVDRAGVEGMLRPGRLSNADSKFLFSFVAAKLFLEAFS